MTPRPWPLLCALAAAVALQGCGAPPAPPPQAPPPETTPDTPAQSEASLEMERHFAWLQAELLAQGLLRSDGGGPDAPFSADDLVSNFERIALYDEYVLDRGRFVARESESVLRRWTRPVRIGVRFGDGVPPEQRRKDMRTIGIYATRLARATGHPVSFGIGEPNFHVLILREDERRSYRRELADLGIALSEGDIAGILRMPRSTLCHVFGFSGVVEPNVYDRAVAVIRAEHPDHLRRACIHEELAQGLGLANDSRRARPSIFNDDEEFGVLTGHDELLLRMLYDPRLWPGMTPDEARPVLEQLARELLAGEG